MDAADHHAGEIQPASIFVVVLVASSYTSACATSGQTQNDWLTGIGRARTFIGDVPALIVPDNPRTLVAVAMEFHITRYIIAAIAKSKRVASHTRGYREGLVTAS